MQAQGSNSHGHVTTEPTIHDVNVTVDDDPKSVQATVSDMRASAVEELGRLAQTELNGINSESPLRPAWKEPNGTKRAMGRCGQSTNGLTATGSCREALA